MNTIQTFLTSYNNIKSLLIIWIVILSILYSALAIVRHNKYESGAYDLGIFDQTVYQYAHLKFPYNTIKERFILGDHLTLTLPLLAPIYRVWPDVRALLVIQSVAIVSSLYAIFLIAKQRALPAYTAGLLSVGYSLFYGIQTAVSFDFHPVVLGVALVAWSAAAWEHKKWKALAALTFLGLATQENIGIAYSGLGLIYFFHNDKRKLATAFIVGGVLISLLQTQIVASLSPVGYQYKANFSFNPLHFFDSDEKITNWKFMTSQYAGVFLLSPGAMLAILLDLTQYFLSGQEYARMWTPYQHHRAILAVFTTLGVLDVLTRIAQTRRHVIRYATVLLFLALLISQYAHHLPLNKLVKKAYWEKAVWTRDMDQLIKQIPQTASIAAPQHIVPHISQRDSIYLVWPRQRNANDDLCDGSPCYWLDFVGNPEYLLISTSESQTITQLLSEHSVFIDALQRMEKRGKITLYKEIGTAKLYKVN